MIFDTLTKADCLVAAAAPPNDPRCSDSSFAAANPSLCAAQSYLVIKPESVLICELGSVQFEVFEYSNGVETPVTSGVTFESNDPDIFAVGVNSGSGSGLSSGTTSVIAKFNGMSIASDVTILAGNCCSQVHAKTSILIDNSRSTSLVFGNGYPSRLIFAQAAAQQFAENILKIGSAPKDSVKVWSFADVPNLISSAFITDQTELSNEISGVVQTQAKTDLLGILQAAINDLIAATADEKIILLISDGEQTVNSNTQPILDAASQFTSAGGIIMVIGLRASGVGFDLLGRIATGGFFINAVTNNAADILARINQLKTALCIGQCVPEGNVTINEPQLNYSSFNNFEVIAGMVNLIGNGLLDLLPGNGLYLDLAGGDSPVDSSAATIRTIDNFPIVAGRSYRLSFTVAGNNRINANNQQAVQLSVVNTAAAPTDPDIFDHVVTPNWNDGFLLYSFTFVAPISCNVKLIFQQLVSQVFVDSGAEWHGNLLGNITFEEVSTLTTLFTDNFDDENPVFIPPPTGAYGYDVCPSTPVGTQIQDPNPLPDIESSGGTTQTFTSTKSFCASCPDGQIVNLIPAMTSDTEPSGIVSSSNIPGNNWFAFSNLIENAGWISGTGLPAWIQYQFPTPQVVSDYIFSVATTHGQQINIVFSGSNNGLDWTELDSENKAFSSGQTASKFTITSPQSFLYYRLTMDGMLFSFGFKLGMYGSGNPICSSATATSFISQADADAKALSSATLAAQSQLNCVTQYLSTQTYTANCPLGTFGGVPVTKSASATSIVSQTEADAMALAAAMELANAALICNASNNTQKITINDNAAATPYPSTKFVSGLSGVVTKVTASIKGLSHTNVTDVQMVLRSPSGETCLLMLNCGGNTACDDADLVFDDSAPQSLPTTISVPIVSGTYKPTAFGFVGNDMKPPMTAHPYGAALSVFNGINPNGSWSLWVQDNVSLDIGQIAGGFDLVITSD